MNKASTDYLKWRACDGEDGVGPSGGENNECNTVVGPRVGRHETHKKAMDPPVLGTLLRRYEYGKLDSAGPARPFAIASAPYRHDAFTNHRQRDR